MDNQEIAPSQTIPPKPPIPPQLANSFSWLKILLLVLIIAIPIGVGGYVLGTRKNQSVTPIPQQRVTVTSSPTTTDNNTSSPIKSNKVYLKYPDKAIIISPDNKKVATFYYKGPAPQGEGSGGFSDVDVSDKDTSVTKTYHLTGPLSYPSARSPLYWSPLDNRIYFALSLMV